jgi:hypothetical protein
MLISLDGKLPLEKETTTIKISLQKEIPMMTLHLSESEVWIVRLHFSSIVDLEDGLQVPWMKETGHSTI